MRTLTTRKYIYVMIYERIVLRHLLVTSREIRFYVWLNNDLKGGDYRNQSEERYSSGDITLSSYAIFFSAASDEINEDYH